MEAPPELISCKVLASGSRNRKEIIENINDVIYKIFYGETLKISPSPDVEEIFEIFNPDSEILLRRIGDEYILTCKNHRKSYNIFEVQDIIIQFSNKHVDYHF